MIGVRVGLCQEIKYGMRNSMYHIAKYSSCNSRGKRLCRHRWVWVVLVASLGAVSLVVVSLVAEVEGMVEQESTRKKWHNMEI